MIVPGSEKARPLIYIQGKPYLKARLILEWKLGRPLLPGMYACHTCDNGRCIQPEHLWEGTNSENIQDSVRKGRFNAVPRKYTPSPNRRHNPRRGEDHPLRKLTNEQVYEIRRLNKTGIGYRRLARLYGLEQSSVGDICRGRIWKHLLKEEHTNEP